MDQDAPVSYCNWSGADVCVIMYQKASLRSCVSVRQDVFTISVGNLPPGATVLIKVTFITELLVRSGSIIFSLSGSVAPWQQSAALNQTTQVWWAFVTLFKILFGLMIVAVFWLTVVLHFRQLLKRLVWRSFSQRGENLKRWRNHREIH